MSKPVRSNKGLEYYLTLDYPVEVHCSEKGYVAEYVDLPGCIAQGETEVEARDRLKKGREAWFKISLELGMPISLPYSTFEVKPQNIPWDKVFVPPPIKICTDYVPEAA
jgi:predicted RNase H-like HicB family nuclease